ncbi:MAG: hypothetical protein BWX88_05204 [Planctomycetes bacterium ADurb.Bin126]|nr:MAG: hypothetical protein BWX88_05204 [Planctomycetes bacterium ADurb.Bin126]
MAIVPAPALTRLAGPPLASIRGAATVRSVPAAASATLKTRAPPVPEARRMLAAVVPGHVMLEAAAPPTVTSPSSTYAAFQEAGL